MGNPKAFMSIARKEAGYRPIHDRIHDYGEVEQTLNSHDRQEQASRCMDCGVPFCHWACPLGSKIPEWNDLLYNGDWEQAYETLITTNEFPEFTGRVCPALCEKSCVLNHVIQQPTTNRENEVAIMEHAFIEGYVVPLKIRHNDYNVAIIGSGPAGLAVANRLNRMGYNVTVYEKNEMIGGLLRFGIPNFKLNKTIIDRRVSLMEKEGVKFVTGTTINTQKLPVGFHAYAICTGTPQARDLNIDGRELNGIHLALDYLSQQNRILAGMEIAANQRITAKGKNVLVIGGGDTGADCIATAHRQGCRSVTQIEIMPKPPVGNNPATPWPSWPVILKTTFAHEEGCERKWLLNTNRFVGTEGKVSGAEVEEIKWEKTSDNLRPQMKKTGNIHTIKAELVLLAMGFIKPEQPKFPENVFVAGDAKNGPGLVVKAICSGQKTAAEIDNYLNT